MKDLNIPINEWEKKYASKYTSSGGMTDPNFSPYLSLSRPYKPGTNEEYYVPNLDVLETLGFVNKGNYEHNPFDVFERMEEINKNAGTGEYRKFYHQKSPDEAVADLRGALYQRRKEMGKLGEDSFADYPISINDLN